MKSSDDNDKEVTSAEPYTDLDDEVAVFCCARRDHGTDSLSGYISEQSHNIYMQSMLVGQSVIVVTELF